MVNDTTGSGDWGMRESRSVVVITFERISIFLSGLITTAESPCRHPDDNRPGKKAAHVCNSELIDAAIPTYEIQPIFIHRSGSQLTPVTFTDNIK
jgi:hypothetical protein